MVGDVILLIPPLATRGRSMASSTNGNRPVVAGITPPRTGSATICVTCTMCGARTKRSCGLSKGEEGEQAVEVEEVASEEEAAAEAVAEIRSRR